MSAYLIIVIGFVYGIVSVDLFIKQQYGLSIAFLGYAIGNIGLYMEAK